jgi:hypothetical protein
MSMHLAIQALGWTSLHWDRERLNDILNGTCAAPDFRRYDDVDAVSDIPSAIFYRELLAAYPDAKAILTLRDEDAWWTSIERHFNHRAPFRDPAALLYQARMQGADVPPAVVAGEVLRGRLRNLAYGSPVAIEYLYRKRFREHNERVRADVPASRLLVMDVTAGEGWDRLCPFLGVPVPATPFPHANAAPS